jgi:thioredoxin 1
LIPVSFETFEALVEQPSTKHLVAVNCWAEWCGPSKLLEPIYERTAQELSYRMDFVKLNIDDNPELANKFGLRSLPALMLFNDEEPLALISGLIPKDALKAELEYILSMIQQ